MRRTAAGVVMATEMVWPLRTPKSWTLYSGCSLNYADFNLLRWQSGSPDLDLTLYMPTQQCPPSSPL